MKQHQETDAIQFLVDATRETLPPDKRAAVLSLALTAAIAARNEPASRWLFRSLYKAFELDQLWIDDDELRRAKFETRMRDSRDQLCQIVMEAYPMGSIRDNDWTQKPIFLGLRRDLLEFVLGEWNSSLSELQTKIFRFIRESLAPGIDEVTLLPQESTMIEALIRKRLDLIGLKEISFRHWMNYMRLHCGVYANSWDHNLFMLLAIARTRSGGLTTAMRDIAFWNETEEPRFKA